MRPAWIAQLLEASEEESIPPPREADRRAAISVIEQAIGARARRRTRVRWTLSVGAAAAFVLAASSAAFVAHRGGAAVARGSSAPEGAHPVVTQMTGAGVVVEGATSAAVAAAASAPVAVGKGSRIVVRPGGHAALGLSTGTELTLDDRGEMAIVDDGRSQVFSLASGSMRAHVAKLAPGDRFVVRTPDAEVEVRGTIFTVSLVPSDAACGDGTVTRVVVDEGVVVVRRHGAEARVARGERWPAGCTASEPTTPRETTSPAALPPATSTAVAAAPVAKATSKPAATAVAAASTTSSSLSEQNALFAEGIAYKNGGQTGAAIGIFEQFMAKYPSSALAENAAVERMRLLASIDRARGAAAASQYLRRYPNGFGKTEARAIVASGP